MGFCGECNRRTKLLEQNTGTEPIPIAAVSMSSQNIFEKHFGNSKTLFSDREAISPHFIPDQLPNRESQIQEISETLSAVLAGKKASNIFLYGKTGTGKTAVTRHVLRQLLDFAKGKSLCVTGMYINCRNHNRKYRVLSKIVEEIFPEERFFGFSAGFVYDKLVEWIGKTKTHLVIILDEIDKVRDLDDLVYSLTRANDEVTGGGITLVGISNNLFFRERLDPRTKSSLVEKEMVFPPYNAEELRAILNDRVKRAFIPDSVEESAVNLAAAYAANESGDARTAVMLLFRAGELAEQKGSLKVTDDEVRRAKKKVEEELITNMVSTLPKHQQILLFSLADLSLNKKPQAKLSGQPPAENVLFSGEVYEEYCMMAKRLKEQPVSSRWYREYISELEMFGLVSTTASGQGFRGNSRIIRLGFEPKKIRDQLEKELMG